MKRLNLFLGAVLIFKSNITTKIIFLKHIANKNHTFIILTKVNMLVINV